MYTRLKEIRKSLKISQEEMGSRLGVTGTAISRLEKGERNITDQMVISICREFNINEEWLRYGTGEKCVAVMQEDEFFRAAAELSKEGDAFITASVIEYWKLDKDSRSLLRNYLLHIAERIKKEEQL